MSKQTWQSWPSKDKVSSREIPLGPASCCSSWFDDMVRADREMIKIFMWGTHFYRGKRSRAMGLKTNDRQVTWKIEWDGAPLSPLDLSHHPWRSTKKIEKGGGSPLPPSWFFFTHESFWGKKTIKRLKVWGLFISSWILLWTSGNWREKKKQESMRFWKKSRTIWNFWKTLVWTSLVKSCTAVTKRNLPLKSKERSWYEFVSHPAVTLSLPVIGLLRGWTFVVVIGGTSSRGPLPHHCCRENKNGRRTRKDDAKL